MFTDLQIKLFFLIKIFVILSISLGAQCPPPLPIVKNQVSCEPSNFRLEAIGNEINWYNSPITTIPIAVGNIYTTTNVVDSIVLFVSSKNTALACESPRVKVVGLIKPYTGDSTLVGNNEWAIHCFDKVGINLNYRGRFIVNNINYNSILHYDSLASPKTINTTTPSYEGCRVSVTSHVIKGKRRGFLKQNHQIQVPIHEGACKVSVNGTVVYQRSNRSRSNRVIWTGPLDVNSVILFEYDNTTGKSIANLIITPINTLPKIIIPKINGSQTICPLETPSTLIVNSYKSVAVHDAYVQDGINATTRYGVLDPQILATKSFGTGENKLTYLNFDISNIAGGISTAKLSLLGFNSLGINPNQFAFVHALDDTVWNESTLRWSTRPIERNPFIARTIIDEYVPTIYNWDITSYIQQLRAQGRKKVSLVVKNTDFRNFNYTYASKENPLNSPPTLLINEIESVCGGLFFQWQQQIGCIGTFEDLAGENSKVFYQPPSNLVNSVCYRLKVTDNCDNLSYSDTSMITVNNPTVIQAKDVFNCGPDSLKIVAKGYSQGQYRWFNSATSGNILAIDSTLNTSIITNDSSVFVTGFKNGCEGVPRKEVNIRILKVPTLPEARDTSRCGPGEVTLIATSSDSIYWFNDSLSLNKIGVGTNIVIPSIQNTRSVYLKALSTNGCFSPSKKLIARINPVPNIPSILDTSRCGPGRIFYKITNPPDEQSLWYSNETGLDVFNSGAILDTFITTDFGFYVSNKNQFCESKRKQVTAQVLTIPSKPLSYDTTKCDVGNISLSARNVFSRNNWYLDSSKTVSIAKNSSSIVIPIFSDSVVYVVNEDSICESKPSSISIRFNTTPAIPFIKDTSSCGSNAFVLSAKSTGALKWFNSNNQLLKDSIQFKTTLINSTTSYSVLAYNEFCESNKKSFTVNILPIPASPSSFDTTKCNSGLISITAKNGKGITSWYSDTLQKPLYEGTLFAPVVNSDSTLYLQNSLNGCISPFSKVKIIFANTPSAPVVNDTSSCGATSFTIKPAINADYNWYNSLGSLLSTDDNFTTPIINDSVKYLVTTLNKHCESNKTSFNLKIKPVSQVGILKSPDSLVCENNNSGIVTLSSRSGNVVRWLNSDDNINFLTINSQSNDLVFNDLKEDQYYKVEVKNGDCPSKLSDTKKITVRKLGKKGILAIESIQDNGGTIVLQNYTGNVVKFESSKDTTFKNKIDYIQDSPYFNFDYTLFNTYIRAVTENYPCQNNITYPLKIESIRIFTSFSPNGDQINDTWIIEGLNERFTAEVRIFNKEGLLVYEEKGYNNSSKVWDGHSNGFQTKELEEGTYFFNVKISDKTPTLGFVVLKR